MKQTKQAIEEVDADGFTRPMREAVVALVRTYSYAEAAKKAGVGVKTVREWAKNEEFVQHIGRFVIGLADNE